MKKLLSLVLALVMVCSLSVTVFAEGEKTGTTTLTANIPNAAPSTYTLHIPADTTLEYANTKQQELPSYLFVDNVLNNSEIKFTSTFTDLINTADSGDVIPLKLFAKYYDEGSVYEVDKATGKINGNTWSLYNYNWTPVDPEVIFYAQVADWSGATPGATYQAVITFKVWVEN